MNRITSFIALLLCFCAPLSFAAGEKKHIEQELMVVAPDEIERLWDGAAIVAKVKITALQVRGFQNSGPYPDVYTQYEATVVDSFEGTKTGNKLHFLHRAGTLETEDAVIHVANARQLNVDEEYIVFLRRVPVLDAFVLSAGEESAFGLTKGVITPAGRGLLAARHVSMPVERFTAEIRSLARTRPHREAAQ